MALSVPELRRLLTQLVLLGQHGIEHVLQWSVWRRRHQYRARQCHYRRRGFVPP